MDAILRGYRRALFLRLFVQWVRQHEKLSLLFLNFVIPAAVMAAYFCFIAGWDHLANRRTNSRSWPAVRRFFCLLPSHFTQSS